MCGWMGVRVCDPQRQNAVKRWCGNDSVEILASDSSRDLSSELELTTKRLGDMVGSTNPLYVARHSVSGTCTGGGTALAGVATTTTTLPRCLLAVITLLVSLHYGALTCLSLVATIPHALCRVADSACQCAVEHRDTVDVVCCGCVDHSGPK